MFDDETVDIACPKCGRRNPLLLSDLETNPRQHIVCAGCQAQVSVDATEFQHKLKDIEHQVEAMEQAGEQRAKSKVRTKTGTKDHWSI